MKRSEAIYIISLKILTDLTVDRRQGILMDIYSENDEYENIVDVSDATYNKEILDYITVGFTGITNLYLEKEGFKIDGFNSKITDGEDYSLLKCYCCDYKTIFQRGHYDICPLCNWEDDGSDDLLKYSSANRSNLFDAKKKFLSTFNNKGLSICEDVLIKYHKGE